jgi:hypothetical protein
MSHISRKSVQRMKNNSIYPKSIFAKLPFFYQLCPFTVPEQGAYWNFSSRLFLFSKNFKISNYYGFSVFEDHFPGNLNLIREPFEFGLSMVELI